MTYDSDGRPVGDRELFAIMRGAMKVLNFSSEDESNIYRIMAIVLHLGNIQFGGTYIIKAINIEKGPRASCSNFLCGEEISQKFPKLNDLFHTYLISSVSCLITVYDLFHTYLYRV